MRFYISLSTYLPSLIFKILVNVILVYGSLTAVLLNVEVTDAQVEFQKTPYGSVFGQFHH